MRNLLDEDRPDTVRLSEAQARAVALKALERCGYDEAGATIITDGNLIEVAVGPELVIKQADEVLEAMDAWNKSHHGGSGLIARVKASEITDGQAE